MSEDRGTYRAYKNIKFRADKLELIGRINALIEKYEAKGLSMTLRQIHYQFVINNWAPNTSRTYNGIKSALNDGRLAGLISWDAIEDGQRALMGFRTYENTQEALRGIASGYKRDLWQDQEYRCEVWVEKFALAGVVAQICNKLRVDYYPQRGYDSQSQSWRAGQRFADYTRKGQRVIVFHLGDHDPSGVDMTRDNRERLEMFSGTPILVQRLALNMDQIERYNPPPQFAKEGDSRIDNYKAEYGTDQSWELDALEPTVIQKLIEDAVLRVRDERKFSEAIIQEEEDKRYLREVAGED